MATYLDETRLQEATSDILHEALKTHNQVYKLNDVLGQFIKVRKSYAEPEDNRMLYLSALDVMLENGMARLRLKNNDLEMYEVKPDGNARKLYLEEAKQQLYEEATRTGIIYKVHSVNGEFVQCGDIVHAEIDDQRILYLEALCDLLRHDVVQIVSENRELSTYQLVQAKSSEMHEH